MGHEITNMIDLKAIFNSLLFSICLMVHGFLIKIKAAKIQRRKRPLIVSQCTAFFGVDDVCDGGLQKCRSLQEVRVFYVLNSIRMTFSFGGSFPMWLKNWRKGHFHVLYILQWFNTWRNAARAAPRPLAISARMYTILLKISKELVFSSLLVPS